MCIKQIHTLHRNIVESNTQLTSQKLLWLNYFGILYSTYNQDTDLEDT